MMSFILFVLIFTGHYKAALIAALLYLNCPILAVFVFVLMWGYGNENGGRCNNNKSSG